jgi:hypothetical protein
MKRHALSALALAALLSGCAAATQTAPAIDSTESLVRAMHDRWQDRWYHTLSFTQATTRMVSADSSVTETWREWARIPGALRIETGPGRGTLFTRDSTFAIANGRVARALDSWNALMTVGFDVYRQPVETTMAQLGKQGFALDRFHVDTLEGVPVYVVGAARGDSTSKQFAIEADRLLFLRFTDPTPQGPAQIWFRNYQPLAEAWIAPEVEVLLGGRRVFHEVYSDIRANETLDPVLFDPYQWEAGVAATRP